MATADELVAEEIDDRLDAPVAGRWDRIRAARAWRFATVRRRAE